MERLKFNLTDFEELSARLFRKHHKKSGCLVRKGLLRRKVREVQETCPTYTYLFSTTSTGEMRKYIRCNFCGETEELTGHSSKKRQIG